MLSRAPSPVAGLLALALLLFAESAEAQRAPAHCPAAQALEAAPTTGLASANECTSAQLAIKLASRTVSAAESAAPTSQPKTRKIPASGALPDVCDGLAPPAWACVGCEYPVKNFANYDIPESLKLGDLHLDVLKPEDLEQDLAAVLEGPDSYLEGLFGGQWPQDLTRQGDLVDLCWHYDSFLQKRSFAWAVRDAERNYLGCAYYFPIPIDKDAIPAKTAQAFAWIRFESKDSPETKNFYADYENWIKGPSWPDLKVQFYTPENKQPRTGGFDILRH